MKKQKQQAATTFTTDHDGRRIAHVALSDTQGSAKLLADDLERILMDGYSPCWAYTRTPAAPQATTTPHGTPRETESFTADFRMGI